MRLNETVEEGDESFKFINYIRREKFEGVSLSSSKTRIIHKNLINKPKSMIWKNRLTSLSINSTPSPQRRLQLWRGKMNEL
ncbi:MAG: hypothetical protein A3G70_06030 [Planctomycetes bacterium RIFCSPLOWO2_12_FULL_39_13]|nr:MAG: hypothetical protein A2Y09_06305 [Planctomycetes bacterium GWA2_39_15]OHC00297.1 MAG: hypothetical protein A3G70_06030 [Planctomycetes bacterium RIFCSPLOWO2_12_FULL_39_13]